MPALQLCQEIVSLIETIKDFDLELIEMLGELLLKDNGQINSPSAFDQIISILNHIHQSNPDYSLTLHRFYCYYIMRCLLSNPDDSQVLTTALDMVSKGKTFDKKLSYFGKCLDFVVMLESSIHEDLIINIVVDTVDEIPPFIECLDNFLQNIDTDETGENVLLVLLADAVQKSFNKNTNNGFKTFSPFPCHLVDKIAFTCFDTIGNSEVSNFTSSKVRKYVCKN
jgi:hypothetical protein